LSLLQRLPGDWLRARIPCHDVLADGTVTGIRMLHHLHVLLFARFWRDRDLLQWSVGHPMMMEPIDALAERIHIQRAIRGHQ
jgi:hypothetical protein